MMFDLSKLIIRPADLKDVDFIATTDHRSGKKRN